MHNRTVFTLSLIVLLMACKKDEAPPPSRAFNGVVLYYKTGQPITGAQVAITLMDNWHQDSIPRKALYSFAANKDYGQYTQTITDVLVGLSAYYGTSVRSRGLVQLRSTYLHPITRQEPDTLLMDDAFYLNIHLKGTSEPSMGGYTLEWNFLEPGAPAALNRHFYSSHFARAVQPATIRDSFSLVEHDRVYMRLSRVEGDVHHVLKEKTARIDSGNPTVDVTFEY